MVGVVVTAVEHMRVCGGGVAFIQNDPSFSTIIANSRKKSSNEKQPDNMSGRRLKGSFVFVSGGDAAPNMALLFVHIQHLSYLKI